jgi:hypothetical protein
MFHKKHVRLCILFLLLGSLAACQQMMIPPKLTSQFPAEVATSWFELQLKLIKETPGCTPPVASRALGYSSVALYESVVDGMPEYQSLVGQLNGLTSLPQPEAGQAHYWAAVANSALATILRSLYPTATPDNLAAIDALEQKYAKQYEAEAGAEVFNCSVAYGQALAAAIFEWSKTDGGHEGYSKNFPERFTPPGGLGLWVPTAPNYQAIPLQPYWGQNRPFVIQSGEECTPAAPTEYSEAPSSQFYAEGMEVYQTVKHLTPEQKEIALFWADDPGKTSTPPGHSVSIATQVLREKNATLALAAETYARVGLAVADAFIDCWNTKYIYNLIRPISYIQTVIDPTWNNPDITDPVTTPPFPEYPSGHSVQSGAAATVLTALFGDNYRFTDNTHVERGLPARTFNSFFEAADEAAISRLYGGIHYRPAIESGLEQGQCIGEKVNALAWKKQS